MYFLFLVVGLLLVLQITTPLPVLGLEASLPMIFEIRHSRTSDRHRFST